jgi:branched-chain amino acid transport system ATP-binding protein
MGSWNRVTDTAHSEALLQVDRLEASYGRIAALRGISLYIEPGEIVALLGANGAGKSTTLKAIMGLMQDVRGAIRFRGEDIVGRRTEDIVRSGIAMVPEGRRVFSNLTVAENLRLGAASRRDRDAISQTYELVFDLFPVLKERYRSEAGTLSGGMQQMLVIGRALMASPTLLLLDEPSLGLAPQLVDRIFDLLARLPETGVTMLVVEQSIDSALALADRAYILRTGQLILSGAAEELRERADLKREYLGMAT